MRMNESLHPIGKVESAASGRHGSSERVPQRRLLTAGRAQSPTASRCQRASTQQSSPVLCERIGPGKYIIRDGHLTYEASHPQMAALQDECERDGVEFLWYRTEERRR